MIALTGNLLLWLTLILSIFQFLSTRSKRILDNINHLKIIVYGLLISILISFLTLIYLHIVSDFSVSNVYQYSHKTKPLIYKISGVWGNHEGSLILWMFVLVVFNFLIFKLLDKKNYDFIYKTLEIQSIIIIGFIIFVIFTSNPFEIISEQKNGLGFNPILQDPALAIHPPFLYFGYVGFSAVFSMGLAALCLKNNNKIPWFKYMKPFVASAWTFLTIGIGLGSLWAYYELGWGGWWFWDPVEHASFMPWLLGTALLHSLIIVEKKKSLQTWVLLLSILTFLLSVIGTFLVRSGILTSVHTFALDPTRGLYILIFILLLTIYSFILFSQNSKKYFSENYFSIFSKEGSILINNILITIVCATVFLGTTYPLIIEALTNNKISVGEPYYNSITIPIIIPAILIMGIGPILSWGKENKIKVIEKILPSLLFTLVMTITTVTIYKSYNFMGIIGMALGFWIISNNLMIIFKKNIHQSTGMIISHLGIGLLIIGITASSIWQKEKIVKIKIGDKIKIERYNVLFNKIKDYKGPNYVAIQGLFQVYNNKKEYVTLLKPENRFYPVTKIFTTEVSIHTNLLRDLYIVLGDGNINDGWIVKIYHNPLVVWIWIGTFIIFIGGLLTIKINLKKIKNLTS